MAKNYEIQDKEDLLNFVGKNWNRIDRYLTAKAEQLPVPVYSSVDIRESHTKFAPVDHNFYPAGFNNLCNLDLAVCGDKFKAEFTKASQNCSRIGIIPESHTKNAFYLDHLAILTQCIQNAGFEVEVISFDSNLFLESQSLDLVSHSGFDIELNQAEIKDGLMVSKVSQKGFCCVLLNHDQSHPINLPWNEIKTKVVPSPLIGWFRREKIKHFKFYKEVVDEFCEDFSIDPNLLQAKFVETTNVDFASKEGLDLIGEQVDALLAELPNESKVFVKASQGTYGMGISVVTSGEQVTKMNRKARNKMDIGKNKRKFTSVLIQEGIETIIKYQDSPAEVTIYLVGGQSVGGFMRANPEKSSISNLNAKGMVFQKFCISEIREAAEHKAQEAVYSMIARLSTLASAHELKEVMGEQ